MVLFEEVNKTNIFKLEPFSFKYVRRFLRFTDRMNRQVHMNLKIQYIVTLINSFDVVIEPTFIVTMNMWDWYHLGFNNDLIPVHYIIKLRKYWWRWNSNIYTGNMWHWHRQYNMFLVRQYVQWVDKNMATFLCSNI